MDSRTRSKKSETLEVRLSPETKAEFMLRCRDQGRTASEAVRAFVERELQTTTTAPQVQSGRWRLAIAAAAAGLAVGAVAAPTLAHPFHTERSACDQVTHNDGPLDPAAARRN